MHVSTSTPTLTSCQVKALDMLHREGNVFLTGAAGTGKSFLLDQYLRGTSSADFPLVASTGVAAVLIGGRTFHSFFGLGILEGGPEAAVAKALGNRRVVQRLRRACCVIIDEISMLPGVVLKAADTVARKARSIDAPWGGLRIVVVGDFAQLPPVTPGHTEKDWAFCHDVWRESVFQPALLSTVMRAKDSDFLEILNFVREGVLNDRVRTFLDHHTVSHSEHVEGTRLYPHRAQAEQYNVRRLEAIPTKLFSVSTQYEGDERSIENAKRVLPIPDVLLIKKGALVMLRKNDPSGSLRWVNGSLGHIQHVADDVLTLTLLSGEEIELEKEKFTCLDGDGREVAAAWNFPVTLAWATTIHKAQGATLDRMVVDLHALWEPGHAYVALSRVRGGDGLLIERWSPSSIRAEPIVTSFYDALAADMLKYKPRPLFVPPLPVSEPAVRTVKRKQLSRHDRMRQIAGLVQKRLSLENIAKECGIKPQRVLLYFEKLLADGQKPDLTYLIDHISHRTIIENAFDEYGALGLTPVFQALEGTVSFDDLRLVRCASGRYRAMDEGE